MCNSDTDPLPDTGQWLLLALNEKLPGTIVQILRARIIGLHHFLMLFMMLAFSVLFDSVEAPGLGLGARYMFTMAVGRLLRAITFVSTILPSARPWCASARFRVPTYPHYWAQKYYVPYASDASAIRQIINHDMAYGMCCLSNSICFVSLAVWIIFIFCWESGTPIGCAAECSVSFCFVLILFCFPFHSSPSFLPTEHGLRI